MRRFRFNIASLLVVILFVGLGFAALWESSDLWDSSFFITTLGVLLISWVSGRWALDSRSRQ
jgi:predicted acyltransferase